MPTKEKIKFIDLFAGMGGMRLGFEQACQQQGLASECILSSEIKPYARTTYQENFVEQGFFVGDITQVMARDIPNFDFLLAGFPCQPFSSAGNRHGFMDTRGTLFFEIARILQAKQPYGFLLENVEGLVNHDKGRTLSTIVDTLDALGYQVTWQMLNAKNFAVPQERKRIFIVGTKDSTIHLTDFSTVQQRLATILEKGLATLDTPFSRRLLKYFPAEELHGKAIKDKRGGNNNIHSWDIALKGEVTIEQKRILEALLRARRQKHWATYKGIAWMDGMPLTLAEIASFYQPMQSDTNLEVLLDDLVAKGYLKFEHPKDLVDVQGDDGKVRRRRQYREDLPRGYNIVVGKLSFEISKILDPQGFAPTLVATDIHKLAVVDGQGIRHLSLREGLRLNGFPEWYNLNLDRKHAYDLLGNTVAVPVIRAIMPRLLEAYTSASSSHSTASIQQHKIKQPSLFHTPAAYIL